jgi:hypothetical protein
MTADQIAELALRAIAVSVVPLADRPAFAAIVPAATIATNALLWAGIVAPEDDLTDPARAPDQAYALTKVLAVHDALVARAFVSWTSATIPKAVSEEYAMLTAQHIAPAFGKALGDAAGQEAVEARVGRMAMILSAPAVALDAVVDVHNDLASRGKVRWSIFDVPTGAINSYTALAAAQLAPQFPGIAKPPPPGDVVAAMAQLARIIALPSAGGPVVAEYF